MKKILTIIIFSTCFIISAQNNLEISGTIVNQQNIPIENTTVSVPSAFLRTVTSQEGKFNLSLVNMQYKTDDVIKISNKDSDTTIEITIEDYLKLNKKVFVINGEDIKITKNKKELTKNTDTKKTLLIIDNIEKGNKISIKNYKGKTYFTEVIENSNLKKKAFDLNYLKEGNYFFKIERLLKINVIPFSVNREKGIIYNKTEETTLYKPHIRVKNEMVVVRQISQNGEPIIINIYDENNELLYNDTTENEISIQRAFKLRKGNFKFVITSNYNEYETLISND